MSSVGEHGTGGRQRIDQQGGTVLVPRDRQVGDYPDFKVRPISEAWRLDRRMFTYKTAVAYAAYTSSDTADRFGPMPAKLTECRCELRVAGLILPASAPVRATKGYAV